MYGNGKKQIEISRDLNVPRGTVSKIIKKFLERGTVQAAPKTGRPRKTTKQVDRMIERLSKKDPRKTAAEINAELREQGMAYVTDRTVRNRLMERSLFGRSAVRKPRLSQANITKRIQFAQDHILWTPQRWNTVLWSDECKFQLFTSDGKQYVRRPRGERYNPRYHIPTVKHGGGSIMVWACFSRSGVGPICQIEGKMDSYMYLNILKTIMLPYAEEEMPLRWVFQQDNDPKHSSRLVKEWFQREKVTVLDWPSQYPDCNPIEHLWEHIKRKLRAKTIANKRMLYEEIVKEWNNIPVSLCEKLVDSMSNRCKAILDATGRGTKY